MTCSLRSPRIAELTVSDMQENIVAAIIYFAVSVFFLVLYLSIFYHILSHPKERKQTFYKLLFQLSLSDCFMLALNAFYAVPCTILGYQVFGETTGIYIASIDTVTFFTGELTTVLICLHRLSVVYPIPIIRDRMFAGVGLYLSMAFCWLVGFAWVAVSQAVDCPKLYNEKFFYFGYFCQNGTSPSEQSVIYDGNLYMNITLAVVMAIMYVVSFAKLFLSSNQITHEATKSRRRASEKRLLYQSFIIWLVLTYEIISFCIFPRYMPNFTGTIITSLGLLVNAGINPIICLIFHKEIRESTLFLLRCFHGKIQKSVGTPSAVSSIEPPRRISTKPVV